MELVRCYRCMKEFDGQYDICPHCGYDMTDKPKELYHLFPGSVLKGRYIIGVVIGSGGFGVTYKAWDMTLETVVAIKEYFPLGMVNRVPGQKELIVYSGNVRQVFEEGLFRFLDEAQNMAKFSDHENVVNAYGFFEENNTAYIIMEYLDGISFKDFLRGNKDGTELRFTMEIILAVANALKALHKENIIHRDISPDNVFLLNNGKIKLIDFGASRLSVDTEKSVEVQLKVGYAPPEQYQRRGRLGPWTDVYALGAMMYRAVTGVVPEESVDRQIEDTLSQPEEYMPGLPDYINDTIMRALALDISYRFQSVQEFEDALTNRKKVVALQEEIKRRKAKRRYSLIAVAAVLLLAVAAVGSRVVSMQNGSHVKANLDVWVCVDAGEDAEAVKSYYEDISSAVFGQTYKKVNVDVKAVPKEEYTASLLAALIAGDGPDIFESTERDEDLLAYADSLDGVLKKLSSEDYYFLGELSRYETGEKSLPVGFVVPVAFSLNQNAPEEITEGELARTALDMHGGSDMGEMISAFTQGQALYLLGTTGDYQMLQEEIYGTFEQQKEEVAGALHVVAIADAEPRFTTAFSVSTSCNRREAEAAALFLQYLLSYNEQHLLHAGQVDKRVSESSAFSVNVKADTEYRDEIIRAFSVLDKSAAQWKGGE